MTDLRIGVTGSEGFVGSHLMHLLNREQGVVGVPCPRDTYQDNQQLHTFVQSCDVIVHLAGVNRGTDEEVRRGNRQIAQRLTRALRETEATPYIIFASSTQRELDNVYGTSKRECEAIFAAWARVTGGQQTALVIPNVFGPGCRPFYNSVVATFCHLLACGEKPEVHEDREVEFIDVNQLVEQILDCCRSTSRPDDFRVRGSAQLTVAQLLRRLESFRDHFFEKHIVPDLSDALDASLYTTFLSYVAPENHCHAPTVHTDDRGRLFEIIKVANGGQVFFSSTKPGVIRGNHYHTRKVEWFCVVRGKAAIRMRRIGGNEVKEFQVDGENPQFVSIPVFHTHHIENIGESELLTMFWCNEIFDATDPDTYVAKVA